ncbi:Extracellular exo-inulinase [Cyphellophora attinorum]|uniref:Extracellular exo-inulinase n=1 Tax=Cyphellophora attinorum TaxID=1664694 RepID=A0A0N0NQ71_9EURO|nr:Extracellular exo-inulinase [Phialophora attinorum]KPI43568.1 Extracellular exo-inulinase [Phialophora attinorum]
MFTANSPEQQEQAIAYSRDDGYTWTLYANNPVIAINSKNFRDPKVIYHADSGNWVMVLAYATEFTIGVFTSPDLTTWTPASNFSYAGLLGLQYECPNLVQMPYKNASTGETISTVWLLYISINPGAPLGGSVGQYFAGDFNGTHFTPLDNAARIADFGKDNYATQFFYRNDDFGTEDAVSMAWASNWQYTNYVPTGPAEGWQSAASLPRRNWVQDSVRGGYVLASYPYDLDVVLGRELGSSENLVNDTLVATADASNTTGAFAISANITGLNTTLLSNTASLNITIRSSATGETLTSGQTFAGDATFWMDRGNTTAFDNPFFTDKVSTALVLQDAWELLMVVDRSVWEVFLLGGERSATQTFFAEGMMNEVEVSVAALNEGSVVSVKVWELKSTWAEMEEGMGDVRGNVSAIG